MEASITGEEGDTVELTVLDDEGVEHRIEMTHDGTVTSHEQDGYPATPAERTPDENERLVQARWYARYYVNRRRGYGTLEPYENPEHIGAVLLAVDAMSEGELEETFGELQQQLLSRHDSSVEPVVDVPVDPEDHHVTYRQNVYLDDDDRRVTPGPDGEFEAVAAVADDLGDPGLVDKVTRSLGGLVGDEPDREAADDPPSIDAVSGVHVIYSGDSTGGEQQVDRAEDPRDRAPDARLELWVLPLEQVRDLKRLLSVHLACQLRDCYLRMGVEPPEPYRLTGPGLWRSTRAYVRADADLYEHYYVMNEDIDGYRPTAE